MAEGGDAQDRTEDPTQKRIDDAIKRGDVANSPEISTLFVLGAFTLALTIGSGWIAAALFAELRGLLMRLHQIPSDPAAYAALGRHAFAVVGLALVVPVAAVVVAGLAGGLIQHPFIWSTEPLGLKWERVSPMSGAKRLFGVEAWVNLGKGLVKILLVGAVAGSILWVDRDRLEVAARMDPTSLLPAILALSLRLLAGVLCAYVVIALADGLYQRFRWRERLRMSKQEIRDELKESDGDPEVKGRMRQLRAARVKKRMMAAVPTATVIVTNPTHFAVALRYEAGMGAPVCVAKGVDALALRIREVAGAHGVPVMENPPLARALHAAVEIDETIPAEHYRAVAEVIGFVLRTRRR